MPHRSFTRRHRSAVLAFAAGRDEKGLEIPVPTRSDWDTTLSQVIKPTRDRWQESDDATERESEHRVHETNES
jgi:hypothetical protein